MHIRRFLFTAFLALMVFPFASRAQSLPPHGAAVAGAERPLRPTATRRAPSYRAWPLDVGVDLLYLFPADSRFEDGMGLGLSATVPITPMLAMRAGTGYEALRGGAGIDNAGIVPVGFAFLLGFPVGSPVYAGLDVGLRYQFVDFQEAEQNFGSRVAGQAGISMVASPIEGYAIELGAGYRFDILASRNDRDRLDTSGWAVRLGFRFSY